MPIRHFKKRLSKELSILFALMVAIVMGVLGYFAYTEQGEVTVSTVQNKNDKEEVQVERNLVALGDSITNAAVLSVEKRGDNKKYSFSTGTKVNSFYKLLVADGEDIVPYNLAVSGSKSADILNDQIPQVASYNPKYITMVMGGNDVLGGVSPKEFRKNLTLIAAQLKTSDAKVLIASDPDISSIRNMAIPACQKRVTNAVKTAATQAIVVEYKQIIKEVAKDNNFILVDLYNILDSGDISEHDCIHLSESGQKKMAKAFYNALKKDR